MRITVKRANAAGFTLVELLVALLIFSFAIIGYASLNNRLLAAQWAQQQRGLAQQGVLFMVERIKANPAARGCYPLLGGNIVAEQVVAAALECQAYGTLSSQNIAVADIGEWADILAGQRETVDGLPVPVLPEAVACIEELANDRRYQITVVWAASNGGDAPSGCLPESDSARSYLSERALIDFAVLAE